MNAAGFGPGLSVSGPFPVWLSAGFQKSSGSFSRIILTLTMGCFWGTLKRSPYKMVAKELDQPGFRRIGVAVRDKKPLPLR